MLELIMSSLSFVVSACAFIFTVLIYKKRRTFENENHFFNYKLEQYGMIISSISELFELMYSNFHDLLYEAENKQKAKIVEDITSEIEEKMMSLRVILQKGSAFIPSDIIESLDELYNKIVDNQDCMIREKVIAAEVEKAIANDEMLNDELEKIINIMRLDLGVETIDTRLKMRVR